MEKVINLYTESSPNPNSLKFVVNFFIAEGKSFDFPTVEDCDGAPLAKALFEEFDFAQRVFIASNFVTLTKDEATDWYEVIPAVKTFIKEYLTAEKPVFDENINKRIEKTEQEEAKEPSGDKEVIESRIKAILADYVQPAVEQDGGAIQFHSFEDGVVKVMLQGSCSGCPSSTMTLKSGIENLMKKMLPNDVKEVVAEGV
jgi:Fe-S cluster biogenesis protein NfuA